MVKRTIISAAFFFLLCVPVNLAFACTTFCLKGNGEVLFGKNYDWMIGDGLVFVNKRGVMKTSAEESNLIEDAGRKLSASNDTLQFDMGPYEIKTFKLRLQPLQ